MELKTKYQYTYFIYPYVIPEQKVEKYLLKLIKDKKFNLRFFQKEKDLEIDSYFLPTIKKFLFQGFEFNQEKKKRFETFSPEMQAVILNQYPCTMFDYPLEEDIQGKAGEKEGIFFRIQKIQLVCFQTGICFLLIKTNIEESNQFSDVLDFNYKFRDIHSEWTELKKYENIRLQTTTFEDVKTLNEWITQITGKVEDAKELDINTNRFLTYAYTCIEQKDWNENKPFHDIEFEFFKYANVIPSSYKSNFEKKHVEIVNKWKFIKIGYTKEAATLLTTSMDTFHYTKLPFSYENQYLYTYLLVQYQKLYLKKLEKEFKQKTTATQAREKFIQFTKSLWIQEVTNDDIGSSMYRKVRQVSEIEKIYTSIKNKFDIAYKELNLEKENKINKVIVIALAISILLNIINFMALLRLK